MKLDFNDILILPTASSNINSRSEVDPTYRKWLPIITAPMDTVVSNKNTHTFLVNNILVCQPREMSSPIGFKSYSIQQMTNLLESGQLNRGRYLIDNANGHIEKLIPLTKRIKTEYPSVILMVGNIANPETYRLLSEAGADYVRCGIGNGNACSTTLQTGVGYPMASLIKECYEISMTLDNPALIVADGGMKNYSDVIKALALGADYVMLGSIFNKCLESAGDNFIFKRIKVSQKIANWAYKAGIPVYKKFRGMSTKEVQRKWGVTSPKTSEGVIRYRKVEYTLTQWVENFEDYLRSAMSYTGSKTLKDFIGQVKTIQITDNAFKRFNK